MKKALYVTIASLLMIFANISLAFACIYIAHQPKTPKSLQR